MARLPRFDLSGVAQHIVQRGNDRLPCFAAELDYSRYLQDLRDVAQENGCAIHAYVLMTNHVHLLATPEKSGAISQHLWTSTQPISPDAAVRIFPQGNAITI